MAARNPGGIAKRSTRPTKPGRNRSAFGASARKNDGMPIVSAPISVRCRGRNGNTNAGHADRERQQHRVDGLGQVEAGRALDVAEHPASLGHHARERVEVGVEQDELRHRARGVAPVPIAMPMSASFSARASFTPSPVIATVWPRACSAPTIARFCCGVTRPNTRWRLEHIGERVGSSGKRRARRRDRSAPSRPSERGDRPDRARVVAGDHLHAHVLLARSSAASRRRRRGPVPEHDERHRARSAGSVVAVERGGARASSTTARGPRPSRRDSRRAVAASPGQQHVRRPQDPRAAIAERDGAPLARRGEGHRVRPASSHRRASGNARRSRACVAFGAASAAASAARAGSAGPGPSSRRLDALDREPALGERAGLVDAQHVDAREPLDGGSSCTSTRRRASRMTATANASDVSSTSPSGTIATVPATAPDTAGRQRRATAELADEQQRGGRHDRERHVGEDPVDPAAELRTGSA